MRLCRFSAPDHVEPRSAIIDGDVLRVIPDVFSPRPTGVVVPLTAARLLAPVQPSKIVGVGLNYRAHAREMGKPLPDVPRLFLKPSTAVIGPGEAVELAPGSTRVDHEAELAVVIGQRSRNLAPAHALQAVLGYTCANDVTARDFQAQDVQFTRAKGFDTFCPLGPWIETELDPQAQRVSLEVNGALRQDGTTGDMVHTVVELLVFISGIMTLLPGDVISTGTPSGVGVLNRGDKVRITISGIGTLEHSVA